MRIGGAKWVNQRAIAPYNRGLVNVAQNVLENTISRANQQLENALQVDGIQVLLWRRTMEGSACTCSSKNTVSLSKSRLDDTPITTTDDGYSMVPVRGYEDGYTMSSTSHEDLASTPAPFQEGIDTVNGYDPLGLGPEELALLNMERTELFTMDSVPCGICFGTGRTNGYTLYNGNRFVLCASEDHPYTMTGGVALQDTKPMSFYMPTANVGAVVWQVEFPTYYFACTSVAIFNNRQVAGNLVAEYSADKGGTWSVLNHAALTQAQGIAKKWLVRVRTVAPADNTVFTHLVITLEGMDRFKAQTDNMSVELQMDSIMPQVQQSWVFSPSVTAIPRESIFYDSKYGKLWKVQSVSKKSTTNGQIFGYELSARTIQMNERFYPLCNELQSSTNLAFCGLEAFQGGSNVYNNNQINKLDDVVRSFNWHNLKFGQSLGDAAFDNDGNSYTPSSSDVSPDGTKWVGPTSGQQTFGDRTSIENGPNSTPGYFPLEEPVVTTEDLPQSDSTTVEGTIPPPPLPSTGF